MNSIGSIVVLTTEVRAGTGLTVYVLNSSDVIFVQSEVVGVNPLVKRSHDGAGIVRMLQAEGMTQFMDGHQEQVYT